MAQRWSFKEDYTICKFLAGKNFVNLDEMILDELIERLKLRGCSPRSRSAVQRRAHQYLSTRFNAQQKPLYVSQQLWDIARLVFRKQGVNNLDIGIYIGDNFDPDEELIETVEQAKVLQAFGKAPRNLVKLLHSIDFNLTFPMVLQKYLDQKRLKPKQVYEKIYMKADTFSKISSGRNKAVKKENVLRLCIGLELTLDEAEEFMASAGYLFSPAIMTDVVVKACLLYGIYEVMEIDAELCDNRAPTLFSLE